MRKAAYLTATNQTPRRRFDPLSSEKDLSHSQTDREDPTHNKEHVTSSGWRSARNIVSGAKNQFAHLLIQAVILPIP